MNLARFLAARLGSAILTLLLVSIATFAAIQWIPGSYADVVLGPHATAELRAQTAAKYGLDQPVLVQYLKWLEGVVHGDLGTSLTSRTPVVDELGRRIGPTLELVTLALLFAVLLGVALGIAAGLSDANRVARGSTRFLGSLAMSFPDFVVGGALVYLFSVHSWWLRVGSYVPLTADLVGNVRSMALPAFTLGLFGVGLIMRTQRDAIRNVLTQPFITAAVARGNAPATIIRRNVARNSSIPLVTIVAVLVGAFISGTVIVESLFSIPGIGLFFLNSVHNRDYAVVQAAVLISATVFVLANMTADMLYAVLDPRVGTRRATRGQQ
jgi:peptide/nickel transport system permease protein